MKQFHIMSQRGIRTQAIACAGPTCNRNNCISLPLQLTYEPRCKKTCLRGVQQREFQTGLHSYRD